ncbi:hypothetical protein BKA56DRAFT_226669 [Ilyonectria sp. MPI-CAGE-AT-0026]|nr:hypothetical protein BKA56DRAFT_226669 [Ilyonectria sp. MPI-CAGE-AT-0026]
MDDAPSTSHSGLGKSRLRSRGRGFSWLQTVASSVSRASGTRQGLRDPIRTQRPSTSHVQHQFVCARRQSAPSYFCLSDGSPRNNRLDREASRFLRPRIPCDLTSSTTPTCPCPQLQVLRLQPGPHSSPSHKSQAAAKNGSSSSPDHLTRKKRQNNPATQCLTDLEISFGPRSGFSIPSQRESRLPGLLGICDSPSGTIVLAEPQTKSRDTHAHTSKVFEPMCTD